MGSFVATTVIDAPIERVFDYRLEVRNLPRYNPDVSELRALFDGPPAVGSTYELKVKIAPLLRLGCRLRISRIERPHMLEFAMTSLLDAREVCSFESIESGRTRLRFETHVATPGGPLSGLLDVLFVVPAGRRQVARELELMGALLNP
jgi:uncharacterized protein YndB with AHSA1/START domain